MPERSASAGTKHVGRVATGGVEATEGCIAGWAQGTYSDESEAARRRRQDAAHGGIKAAAEGK